MKKITIFMICLMLCVASASAAGFNIPFTEKRFVLVGEGKGFGFHDRSLENSRAIDNSNSNKGSQVREIATPNTAIPQENQLRSYNVQRYVMQYSELAEKYEGEIFKISTNKRTIVGKLQGNNLVEVSGEEVDYEINVDNEAAVIAIAQKYQSGEDVSFSNIEKYVEIPMKIRFDLIKYAITN